MLPRRYIRAFPELQRLPTDEDRRAALNEAWHRLQRSSGYWIAHVAVLILAPLLPVPFVTRGVTGLVISSLFFGAAVIVLYLLTPKLFASSMRRTIRLRLTLRKLPVCLACGYNMSGIGSRDCPECHASTADCHVCHTRYTGLDRAICPRCGKQSRKSTNVSG